MKNKTDVWICESCIRKIGIVPFILRNNKKCKDCGKITGCTTMKGSRYFEMKEDGIINGQIS